LRGQIHLRHQLPSEAPQALFRTANPKRELILLERTFGVTVDQTENRLLNLAICVFIESKSGSLSGAAKRRLYSS